MGQADYIMGTLFWFEFLRSGVRMFKPPVVLAGIAMFLGYLWSWARRMKTELPAELVEFMRAEQRQKLRRWLWRVENSSLHG